MIGLVLVTHGRLAEEFIAATQHVGGPQDNMRAISMGPEDDSEQRRQDIMDAVAEVDTGAGVIVLTDMFGGTPSNLAHGALPGPSVEVVYGASLPLLVKLAKMRDKPLAQAVDAAIAAGQKYMNSAGAFLETTKTG